MNARTPPDRSEDETVMASLRRLARDGTSWMAAEAALARHELASDGRRLKLAVVFGVILALSLFAAVIQGSLLLVLVLAPSVGGITNAAALSTIGMLLVAALMAFAIWRLLARPSGIASLVKRWRMAMDFGEGGSR